MSLPLGRVQPRKSHFVLSQTADFAARFSACALAGKAAGWHGSLSTPATCSSVIIDPYATKGVLARGCPPHVLVQLYVVFAKAFEKPSVINHARFPTLASPFHFRDDLLSSASCTLGLGKTSGKRNLRVQEGKSLTPQQSQPMSAASCHPDPPSHSQ